MSAMAWTIKRRREATITAWYEEQYPVMMAKGLARKEILPFSSSKVVLGDKEIV